MKIIRWTPPMIALLIGMTGIAQSGESQAHPRVAAKHAVPTYNLSFEELRNQIGARIAVHTTLGTTREGVLTRYTDVGISLKLDQDQGGFDLELPRTTVRDATVIIPPPPAPPAAPASPAGGGDSTRTTIVAISGNESGAETN